MPPDSDNTHFLLLGSPSVGKSATIIEYLYQSRALGGRCVIYDKNGDFARLFYREGIDVILNPNDARCADWDVWSEGCGAVQYRTISRALIPDAGSDPFWSLAARLVFESLCEKVANEAMEMGGKPKMKRLVLMLLRMSDEQMAEVLIGTDAASVFNMNSGRMAASIRGTLTAHIETMKYMQGQRRQGGAFSFKSWVNDNTDSWVFLPVEADEVELFKPLITVWIEQYAKAILKRATDSHKQALRFNLVIDELASLNKLSTLDLYLSEARKFGGNAILGTQSNAQLMDIYGKFGAEKLAGSIGTYLIFRNNAPEGAKWSSQLLMKAEVEEVKDNLTVGHEDVRDSLSMNKQIRERVLVTDSEIMNLPNLEGYIRFGRGYGVLKFTQCYPETKDIAQGIVRRGDVSNAPRVMGGVNPAPNNMNGANGVHNTPPSHPPSPSSPSSLFTSITSPLNTGVMATCHDDAVDSEIVTMQSDFVDSEAVTVQSDCVDLMAQAGMSDTEGMDYYQSIVSDGEGQEKAVASDSGAVVADCSGASATNNTSVSQKHKPVSQDDKPISQQGSGNPPNFSRI